MPDHNSLSAPTLSCSSSSFTKRLVQLNRLDKQDFQDWHLPSGMLFASTTFWWGTNEPRPRPHEGLDLKFFLNNHNEVNSLQEGAMIPVLFSGQVVAIFPDFIGQSIMLAHEQLGTHRFYSIYAHVLAEPTMTIGHHCADGEIIARIAQTKKADIPTHLHLSTLWLSAAHLDEICWQKINSAANIEMCDPLPFIHG